MNDEAFLETIRQNPEDDAPRLVYADWLEEQGDIRAEFLRLEVQWAHGKRADVNAPISRRMEQLRAEIDPNWVAWVERTNRHLFFWSNALCEHYRQQSQIGQPLRFLAGGYNLHCLKDSQPICIGDYIYPIRIQNCRIFVMARMRVCEVTTPEAYLAVRPNDAHLIQPNGPGLIFYRSFRHIFVGEFGTNLRLDLPLPRPIVKRLRFKGLKQDFGPKYLDNGNVLHSGDLHGVLVLTAQSAVDIDRCMAHQPFPDLPPAEANLFG
ncbi:MAG TPA: TIGR02996 domain-containing protein [Gemmataceae bacterium]|jgi:uncharacterized protein (TIGR02996 family)|nr:TIGR02996 domain-containing protein [Gemmataceae bacterium]